MNKLKKGPVALLIGAIFIICALALYLLLQNPTVKNLFSNSSLIRIDIPKNSWMFTPEEIVLKKNRTYTVQITNKDDYPHGFSVSELNINQYIPPSTVKTFEMKPTISGEFTSYCSVVCGQGHFKMKGKVKVVD